MQRLREKLILLTTSLSVHVRTNSQLVVCLVFHSAVFFVFFCLSHIGASANLEVVDKFCYLGDRLSVDGDADAIGIYH